MKHKNILPTEAIDRAAGKKLTRAQIEEFISKAVKKYGYVNLSNNIIAVDTKRFDVKEKEKENE